MTTANNGLSAIIDSATAKTNRACAMSPMLINFVAFQIGWFACVLGGAHQLPWFGTLLVSIIIAIHLSRASQPRAELFLILIAIAIGSIWDSFLVWNGWLEYPSGTLIPDMAPHWILAMWGIFATTLNLSLRWLKGRWLLALVSGAIAGPLAYYAGARLGGVVFSEQATALIALSLGWAVLMPFLVALSQRFDGFPNLATAGRVTS
jgi:hypothetical protein